MKKKEWPVTKEADESWMARILMAVYKVDQEAQSSLMVGEVERKKILVTKTSKALVNNKIVVQRRTMSVVQSKAVIAQTVKFMVKKVGQKKTLMTKQEVPVKSEADEILAVNNRARS